MKVHWLLRCDVKLVARKFLPFDVIDALDHCDLDMHFLLAICVVCV